MAEVPRSSSPSGVVALEELMLPAYDELLEYNPGGDGSREESRL